MSTPQLQAYFRHPLSNFMLEADLAIPAHGITGIYGPSGAGKSTLLRCLAGLLRAQEARLCLGEEIWEDTARGVWLPVERRGVGYVAQEPALFPHLSVEKNLAYGMHRTPDSARIVSMEQAVAWLGLGNLLTRRPEHLSGGERQRVAIARALLAGPRLLLLDEPVSALDEASRADILPRLAQLFREVRIPVVLVTHSLAELARFADSIIHLEQGRVVEAGPLEEILPRLGTPGDALSVLVGTVSVIDEAHALMQIETPYGALWAAQSAPPGQRVRVQIAAREVSLGREIDPHSSILNQLPAVVASMLPAGRGQTYVVLQPPEVSAAPLRALVTTRSVAQLGLAPGMPLFARIKGVNVTAH